METFRNQQLDRQPDALAPGVRRRIKEGFDGYAIGLAMSACGVPRGLDAQVLLEDTAAGVTFAVAFVEPLAPHRAICVEHERPRVRDPGDGLGRLFVQQPELPDRVAALVGEQRVGDPVLCCESREHLDAVVADRVERVASAAEFFPDSLQLNELRFAERSPAGAAVEDHERGPPRPVRVKIQGRAIGAHERKIREGCANSRPQVRKINVQAGTSYTGYGFVRPAAGTLQIGRRRVGKECA